MWILPSHTSVSAPDTAVSTSESDKSLATACERLLTAKSKPSRASYFSRAWKAGNLMRLRSGLISGLSLGKSSPVSRYYRAASPVSRFQQPESALPTPIQDTCSLTYSTGSGDADLPLFSWRTSKGSSRPNSRATGGATPPALRFCSMSSENWSAWVTEQRRDYSRRQSMRERHTNASECLSWPTASARDSKGGYQGGRIRNGKLSMDTLDVAVQAYREGGILGPPAPAKSSMTGNRRVSSWTTPTVVDASAMSPNLRPSRIATGRKTDYLARQVQWATPNAGDGKAGMAVNRKQKSLGQDVSQAEGGYLVKAKLNPRFCEALMGLPIGWLMPSCACPAIPAGTSFDWQETALCPSALPSHLKTCLNE